MEVFFLVFAIFSSVSDFIDQRETEENPVSLLPEIT